MSIAAVQAFLADKSHSIIASFTGAATTTALSWSLDMLSRCVVGIVVGVATWLITRWISGAWDTVKKNTTKKNDK